MIAPKAYSDLLAEIQDVMDHGNALGMWRTVAVLHKALDVARSEQYEAMPTNPVTITLSIGPVREQP
jgi:hypothetical protein